MPNCTTLFPPSPLTFSSVVFFCRQCFYVYLHFLQLMETVCVVRMCVCVSMCVFFWNQSLHHTLDEAGVQVDDEHPEEGHLLARVLEYNAWVVRLAPQAVGRHHHGQVVDVHLGDGHVGGLSKHLGGTREREQGRERERERERTRESKGEMEKDSSSKRDSREGARVCSTHDDLWADLAGAIAPHSRFCPLRKSGLSNRFQRSSQYLMFSLRWILSGISSPSWVSV